MHKIFHRISVCCLVLLMSFKLFGGFSYNLYFWWNQKALAKEHCINQNKPKLKCNGQCYLAKQLAKIENDYQKKQNEPAPFQLKSFEDYVGNTFDLNTVILTDLNTRESVLFSYNFNIKLHTQKPLSPPPNFV